MKHTIFYFNNGGSNDWLYAMAIGDDGVVVAQHICSHENYMLSDLSRHSSDFDSHYGIGNWKLEWVETDNRNNHKGLQISLELNKTSPIKVIGQAPEISIELSDNITITRSL